MFEFIAVGQNKYQMFCIIDIAVSLKMSPLGDLVKRSISHSPSSAFLTSTPMYVNRKWTFHILGHWFRPNHLANRLYKSENAEQCKFGGVKAV